MESHSARFGAPGGGLQGRLKERGPGEGSGRLGALAGALSSFGLQYIGSTIADTVLRYTVYLRYMML